MASRSLAELQLSVDQTLSRFKKAAAQGSRNVGHADNRTTIRARTARSSERVQIGTIEYSMDTIPMNADRESRKSPRHSEECGGFAFR